jgi:hypothetical protein
MKKNVSKIILATLLVFGFNSAAQEDNTAKSNIQTYTPSKLLDKEQWDLKIFNNLYTETKATFNAVKADKARENYLTSTLEIFTGVSENNRINVGVLLEYRSNNIGGRSTTSVFNFENDGAARNGLSSFAPAIKLQPIGGIGNLEIQFTFHISK